MGKVAKRAAAQGQSIPSTFASAGSLDTFAVGELIAHATLIGYDRYEIHPDYGEGDSWRHTVAER